MQTYLGGTSKATSSLSCPEDTWTQQKKRRRTRRLRRRRRRKGNEAEEEAPTATIVVLVRFENNNDKELASKKRDETRLKRHFLSLFSSVNGKIRGTCQKHAVFFSLGTRKRLQSLATLIAK
jgi:hypothetical protein